MCTRRAPDLAPSRGMHSMGTTPVGVSVVVNVMVGVEVGSKDDVGVNVTLGVTVLATRWAPWQ